MSDQSNQTSHQELLALWQQKFQDFITDPEITKGMLRNHKAFQDYLHGLYQKSQPNAADHESNTQHDIPADGDVSVHQLAKHINELEQRLSALEQRIHSSMPKAAQ